MELLLGYAAGLLTLLNPCVLPVLPIVLTAALQAGRTGPVLIMAGMATGFVVLGLGVALAGQGLGITGETVTTVAAFLMVVFGTVLLVPGLSAGFATATAGISARADGRMDGLEPDRPWGQFMGGLLLGAVWSPCIGPTLGGAIALANRGENIAQAAAVMTAFSAGVATVMLALAYGAQSVIRRRRAWMQRVASIARPALGLVFAVVGFGILMKWNRGIERWVLETLPPWLLDISVSI